MRFNKICEPSSTCAVIFRGAGQFRPIRLSDVKELMRTERNSTISAPYLRAGAGKQRPDPSGGGRSTPPMLLVEEVRVRSCCGEQQLVGGFLENQEPIRIDMAFAIALPSAFERM